MSETIANKARTNEQLVREKIIHTLRIYPVISPTMLQAKLGPYVKAEVWRKELEQLKDEGVVVEDSYDDRAPTGRWNSFRRIYLADMAEIARLAS